MAGAVNGFGRTVRYKKTHLANSVAVVSRAVDGDLNGDANNMGAAVESPVDNVEINKVAECEDVIQYYCEYDILDDNVDDRKRKYSNGDSGDEKEENSSVDENDDCFLLNEYNNSSLIKK